MPIKKQNKRQDVAEWYLREILPYVLDEDAEIEYLVTNLKDEAFKDIEDAYDEQMSNLEAEGFFK